MCVCTFRELWVTIFSSKFDIKRFDPGLGCVHEPSTIYYAIDSTRMDHAAKQLEELLPREMQDEELVQRCTEHRVLRMNIYNDSLRLTVGVSQTSVFWPRLTRYFGYQEWYSSWNCTDGEHSLALCHCCYTYTAHLRPPWWTYIVLRNEVLPWQNAWCTSVLGKRNVVQLLCYYTYATTLQRYVSFFILSSSVNEEPLTI